MKEQIRYWLWWGIEMLFTLLLVMLAYSFADMLTDWKMGHLLPYLYGNIDSALLLYEESRITLGLLSIIFYIILDKIYLIIKRRIVNRIKSRH